MVGAKKITRNDAVRLAAQATVDPDTVRRVYDGGACHGTTHARLKDAALKLGLPLPPELS